MNTHMSPQRTADMKANLFIAAVAAVGAGIIGTSLQHTVAAGLESRHLAWLGLAVLTVLAGRLSVRLPMACCKVSFSDILIFISVWVFGTDLATLLAALDGCASSPRSSAAWYKRVFNTAAMAISVHLSSRLVWLILPDGARSATGPLDPATLVLPTLLLAGAQYLLNTLLVSVVVALKEGVSLTAIWQGSLPWAGTGYLVGSAAAAALFIAVRQVGDGSLLAVVPFPPLLYLGYRACLDRLAAASPGARPTQQDSAA